MLEILPLNWNRWHPISSVDRFIHILCLKNCQSYKEMFAKQMIILRTVMLIVSVLCHTILKSIPKMIHSIARVKLKHLFPLEFILPNFVFYQRCLNTSHHLMNIEKKLFLFRWWKISQALLRTDTQFCFRRKTQFGCFISNVPQQILSPMWNSRTICFQSMKILLFFKTNFADHVKL